jgi:hypothetical protein
MARGEAKAIEGGNGENKIWFIVTGPNAVSRLFNYFINDCRDGTADKHQYG